ncbi:MAG: dihydroorotate dehydrogenase electron transfer subunit [Johnsonella sp.]|nr:dihydroorotate dehydrogenase electron transfer subunit [Johnsonella sp.]
MPKHKQRGRIIAQKMLCENVYDLWIEEEEIAKNAMPGQFVSVFLKDRSRKLPRPISICEIGEDKKSFRLVYRITAKGSGTEEMSTYREGESLELMGPFGNGFALDREEVMLIAGGIGIPPMLELAKRLPGEKTAVLGYRDGNTFLSGEIGKYAKLHIASEDGSAGSKGNVMDLIREKNLRSRTVMACGPRAMLKAVSEYCMENEIECFLSLEERMACGIGACLACVCKTGEKDEYSHVHNKRICKEGPVFAAKEVIL